MKIIKYNEKYKFQWDQLVSLARNSHFMYFRDYMEYHKNRFQDFSLMFFDEDQLVAALPANLSLQCAWSHQGLSFGGLIVSPRLKLNDILIIFDELVNYLRSEGIKKLYYKSIPHIYHRQPSEDDLYALHRLGVFPYRIDSSTTINLLSPFKIAGGKKTGYNKATKAGVTISEENDFTSFFSIVESRLQEKYQVEPVHSASEMSELKNKFPNNIRLFNARLNGELIAGCLVYVTDKVCHAQYIASNDLGREQRAVDAIILYLIKNVFATVSFFDFGNSNENEGKFLNTSLCSQKEEFGGRTTIQLFYSLEL